MEVAGRDVDPGFLDMTRFAADRLVLLSAALGFASISMASESMKMNIDKREIEPLALHFYRSLPSLGGKMSLVVSGKGASTLGLTFNLGNKQEIGVYQTELSHEDFVCTWKLLLQADYTHLPRIKAAKPGAATICIGEHHGDAQYPELCCFLAHEVPRELEASIRKIEAMAEELRKTPVHVLSGVTRWLQPQLEAGNDLRLSTILSNVGVESFEIENPLESPRAFMLQIIREDAPAQEGRARWADLGPENVLWTPSEKKPKPTGPSTELGPRESLELEVRKKVYLAPGTYRATLHLRLNQVGSRMPPNPRGELRMDLGTLTVTKTRGLWPPWK